MTHFFDSKVSEDAGRGVGSPHLPARRPGRHSTETALCTRATILRVAEQSFIDWGYERASLRYIAGQADVSPTTLRHHFKTKRLLRETVLRIATGRFKHALVAWMHPDRDDAVGTLKQFTLGFIEAAYAEPAVWQLLLREGLARDHRAEQIMERFRRLSDGFADWARLARHRACRLAVHPEATLWFIVTAGVIPVAAPAITGFSSRPIRSAAQAHMHGRRVADLMFVAVEPRPIRLKGP